jgi:hypothetical protein
MCKIDIATGADDDRKEIARDDKSLRRQREAHLRRQRQNVP